MSFEYIDGLYPSSLRFQFIFFILSGRFPLDTIRLYSFTNPCKLEPCSGLYVYIYIIYLYLPYRF